MAAVPSDDATKINGQKQVNDVMKRVLFEDIDQDGSYFSYLFMEKIFGDNRTCQFCGALGSGCVPNGSNSPEVYVIEEGIVGKQVVECVRCKKQETVLSHDNIPIPADERLRIHGREVRYYCKKINHFEVLHDLLELLHVAAIEDVKKKKEKHVEVASFMMQKAKRVCEEWCKSEYAELRYKKYLRLHHETLIDSNYNPEFPPNASEDYKEMYHMMATSFRSNKEKVIRLLKLMKESLFDNPSRPSFMHWVSIAMMHSEQYQDFKSQYDSHTYNSIETTDLKERFLSLNIPVGIKKIPVVFVLFELPRFYHYVDFLTRRLGKRKPLQFLTDKENEELKAIQEENSGVHRFKDVPSRDVHMKHVPHPILHQKKHQHPVYSEEDDELKKVEQLVSGVVSDHVEHKLGGRLPNSRVIYERELKRYGPDKENGEESGSCVIREVLVEKPKVELLLENLDDSLLKHDSKDHHEPSDVKEECRRIEELYRNRSLVSHQMKDAIPVPPRIVTAEQFRGALLRQKQYPFPKKPPIPLGYSTWDGRCKVVVKFELDRDEIVLTSFQLEDVVKKIHTMPSQSSENFQIKVSPPVKTGGNLPIEAGPSISSDGSCVVVQDRSTTLPGSTFGIHAPISIPIPPSRSPDPNAPVYASVETIENVPTDKLLVATNTHGFDLETLKREMRLPDTKIVQSVTESEIRNMPSAAFYRIVKSCSDEIILISKRSDLPPSELKNYEVSFPSKPKRCEHLPQGLSPDLFEGEKDFIHDIPIKRPSGIFSISPLMFATDIHKQPIPILPFIYCSSDIEDMTHSTEIVANFFGVLVGKGVPDIYRRVFEKYLKIGIVLARRAELFEEVEYFGAIKKAEQKELHIMITINLPKLLDEADYEAKLLEEPLLIRKSANKKTTEQRKLSKNLKSDVVTTEAITEAEAGDGDDSGKKKRKRKKKNKKKVENGVCSPTEKDGDATLLVDDVKDKSRKTAREKFRQCDNCHNPITASIRLCSGCKRVCYCNRDCQKAHWKEHKKACSYVLKKELTG